MVDFIHLHTHTQYSLLDGAIRLEALCQRAIDFGMGAAAITDHGNMFGAIKFFKAAKKFGLKPIIGCEVYVAPGSRFEKTLSSGEESNYHLTLLIQNNHGYANLIKLVSLGYLQGFYYKPRIDMELLAQYSQGLFVLTGCLKGEIASNLIKGQYDKALQKANQFKEIFGENLYLEIQDQGLEEQRQINREIVKLSQQMGIPLVATNDCHYLDKNNAKAHEILLCVQTGKTLSDPKRMHFSSDQFYFKSPQEMGLVFSELPQALSNTIAITERCNLEIEFGQTLLPHYQVPAGYTLDSYLAEVAGKGLDKKLLSMRGKGLLNSDSQEIYFARLRNELRIIADMGYSGYFLIVWDFIDYAKRHGIPVGPGRGSAAGSLVAYSLGITDLNPIQYDLLFERFLNPERVSMPDIDIDFCQERRDQVINYVTQKYGRDNVAQIITFGTMLARGVVRDVGRVMNLPYAEVDRIAKLIPSRLNISIEDALKEEPRLKELLDKDDRVKELIETALVLEGMTRHASTHAAGVVISPKPLNEYLPLYKGSKDEITTQFTMDDIESLGLIKMDFLGLTTLTILNNTMQLLKTSRDLNIELSLIPIDDPKTYQLLSDAKTLGVFQLEGSGLRDIIRRLKPETFEDIIALVALYRPGPLQSGMVDDFIKRKHGRIPIEYEVPQLEEVLKETYGVILYQEQVMKIASLLAGFSLGEADILRRAMGKKKPAEMAKLRQNFVTGATSKGIESQKAEKIFNLMEHFAGYGFNKSHSAAYALLAYQTAYFKANYSIEFMAALLTSVKDNTDKIIRYITECREMHINILPPDVNFSDHDFTVVGQGVRFGLAAVKNVGGGAIESILHTRREKDQFESLFDFCKRVDLRIVNRRVIESLIKAGAFASLNCGRAGLMSQLEEAIEWGQSIQKERDTRQISLFSLSDGTSNTQPGNKKLSGIPEWDDRILLNMEKEALGFYLSKHPLHSYQSELRWFTNTNSESLNQSYKGQKLVIGGIVHSLKTITTKKGEPMAFVTLEDLQGLCEVTVFSDIFKESAAYLESEEPILIQGTAQLDEDSVKVVAERIIPLSKAMSELVLKVHVNINDNGLTRQHLLDLKSLLSKYSGEYQVSIHFHLPNQGQVILNLPETLKITPSKELFVLIEDLLGLDSIDCETLFRERNNR